MEHISCKRLENKQQQVKLQIQAAKEIYQMEKTVEKVTMIEKNHTLFGTKIKNLKTNEVGLVIYTWVNQYADGPVDFATCVDSNGKKYNIELDNIQIVEEDI